MSMRWAAWSYPGGLFILLLLGGCATPLQTDRLGDRVAALPAAVELDWVPFFPQEAYQCGPAALATALNWAQRPVTPEQLAAQIYLPARQGSLQLELMAGGRRHGAVPYELKPEMHAVLTEIAAGHPVIVLQNLALTWYPKWHYAVAVGFDIPSGDIVLRSGGERRHVLALSTFERTWRRAGYWALVVLPPATLPATAEELPYLQAVSTLERMGRPDDAQRAYQTALTRWPTSFGALLGIGNSSYARGDIVGAEHAFRRAVEFHPNAAVGYNNLAQALADQGRLREAEETAQRAVALGGPLLGTYQQTLEEIRRRRTHTAH